MFREKIYINGKYVLVKILLECCIIISPRAFLSKPVLETQKLFSVQYISPKATHKCSLRPNRPGREQEEPGKKTQPLSLEG